MDEIKRAMLGDKEAQRAVTERGELLPCPFCGEGPIISEIKTTYLPTKEEKFSVGITEVHIFCPKCRTKTDNVLTKDTLIKFWNTRKQLLTAEEMEILEGME